MFYANPAKGAPLGPPSDWRARQCLRHICDLIGPDLELSQHMLAKRGGQRDIHGVPAVSHGHPADAAFINESGAPCAYLVAVARS